MKTKTLDIANCSDWDLVLATNWAALKSDLSPEVEKEVLEATWRKQDGYQTQHESGASPSQLVAKPGQLEERRGT